MSVGETRGEAPATDGSPLDDALGAAADPLYERLLDAHAGLTLEESHRLNARLVLLLMNGVGDRARVEALIDAAREGIGEG